MNILLFGGTTEGRELSRALVERGYEVTVCVATEYGREEQEQVPGASILTGRKTTEEMKALMQEADICIDATHPYATEATVNITSAAEAAKKPCLRVARTLTLQETFPEGTVFVEHAKEAADILAKTEGNILLTTGTKELPAFSKLPPERLFPRVLPSVENLQACEALHIPHRNILALQGPFSEELNRALLHQKNISYLVTKNGGVTGGFPAKVEAAKATGTTLVVIMPPEETGYSPEEVLEKL